MTARDDKIRKLLLHAYPDRVTVRRENDPSRGVMVGARGVVLEPASVVRRAPLFLSIDPRDVPGGGESRVALASAIEFEWLDEVHPALVQRRVHHRFDEQRQKVLSVRQILFAGLVVKESPAPKEETGGAEEALFEALRPRAEEFTAGDEEASLLLRRARFVAHHLPELKLPDVSAEELLREACHGCTAVDEVRRRGLRSLIEARFTWAHRQALDEHAPERLLVPTGNRIRVDYSDNPAAPPVLAVRLQEVFGWEETPRLARGRVPVLMHLLAPNFRPAQITSDLRSFWSNTYPEVRKELRARYPKHAWPEDPLTAKPQAKGRPR